MNLGNLITLARLYVPDLKSSKVKKDQLSLILSQGAIDIASKTVCLPTNETFNVVAETGDYDLSEVVTRYLVMDKGGLQWYDGSDWQTLDALTSRAEMDKEFPNWFNDDSGDPQRYFVEMGKLYVHPTPDTSGTDYFKLFFGQKPQEMTENSHYPFGHDSEKTHLSVFAESILDWWKWKSLNILEKKDDFRIYENAYLRGVEERRLSIISRRDVNTSHGNAKFGGRKLA